MGIRAAVISDSHIGQRISAYPEELLELLAGFDFLIHAGDHTNAESLTKLRSIGKLYSVRGNMDEISVCAQLPERLLFEVEGHRIGLIHGWGPPVGLARKVRGVFKDTSPAPEIIIFGHSHRTCDRVIGDIRMLNPGSISGNFGSRSGSWGVLTINDNSVDWEIIPIEP